MWTREKEDAWATVWWRPLIVCSLPWTTALAGSVPWARSIMSSSIDWSFKWLLQTMASLLSLHKLWWTSLWTTSTTTHLPSTNQSMWSTSQILTLLVAGWPGLEPLMPTTFKHYNSAFVQNRVLILFYHNRLKSLSYFLWMTTHKNWLWLVVYPVASPPPTHSLWLPLMVGWRAKRASMYLYAKWLSLKLSSLRQMSLEISGTIWHRHWVRELLTSPPEQCILSLGETMVEFLEQKVVILLSMWWN